MNKRYNWFLKAIIVLLGFAFLGLFTVWRLAQFSNGEAALINFSDDVPASSSIDLLLGNGDFALQRCCPHSTAVINPASRPDESYRSFTVKPSDTKVKGNYRSEMRFRSNPLGSRVIYKADIFVPKDWKASKERVIALQWHGSKDFFLLEPGRVPPLEIAIQQGKWTFQKSWDRMLRSSSSRRGNVEGIKELGHAPAIAGAWNKFDIFVHWSTGKEGQIKIWLNGKKIVDHTGPNAHKDLLGPYMKAGVYIPGWGYRGIEKDVPERSLIFDNIVISQYD